MRAFVLVCSLAAATAAFSDPLPSWNQNETKAAVIAFVDRVTDPDSDDYVAPSERIATFDNDGTLWAEKPVYFQLLFAIDRLREMAKADPDILSSDVLRAAADGDFKAVAAAGKDGLLEIVRTTHSGLSVDEFQAQARAWLDQARHPETKMAYE
ncbi:MAG: haloacid dehalogenase-like hydrolase, partial [Thiocapsa sp.]|nr:haloacid dehalogenase-like hydrolase [Thiocapsa sp.]